MYLDTVHMLVNIKTNAIAYSPPSDNPARVWNEVLALEIFGTAQTKDSLMKAGWRAKKVMIMLFEKSGL
jgi:hypothetical protein